MAILYSIQEVEAALQFWGAKEPAVDHALGDHVRILAEVYALMIFYKRPNVLSSDITFAQAQALAEAAPERSHLD